MINSILFDGFIKDKYVRAPKRHVKQPENILKDNIAPIEQKTVTINGKNYKVQEVEDKNNTMYSIMPRYKEVVIIDGKEYDVKDVNDYSGCDLPPKQVVVVDGKEYDVKSSCNPALNTLCFSTTA